MQVHHHHHPIHTIQTGQLLTLLRVQSAITTILPLVDQYGLKLMTLSVYVCLPYLRAMVRYNQIHFYLF